MGIKLSQIIFGFILLLAAIFGHFVQHNVSTFEYWMMLSLAMVIFNIKD